MTNSYSSRKIPRIKTILRNIFRISVILRIKIFVSYTIIILRIFSKKNDNSKTDSKNKTNFYE